MSRSIADHPFVRRLEDGLVRGDGAMGFLLARVGVPREQSFDFLNLTDPKKVSDVHRAYLDEADVDLIETNTFGANRIHLGNFDKGHEGLVAQINTRGVEIAREAAAGRDVFIAGAVGPISHRTDASPAARSRTGEEVRDAYGEQIDALGGAGVDCFIIETVHRAEEGLAALSVARERFPEIPVVFQIACGRRSATIHGDDLETLVRAADEGGAHAVGLNCFLDPAELYVRILEMREWTALPLAAQPNVGRRSTLCEGVFEIDRSLRATVSGFGRKLVEAGVRLIGGCCGITPMHIGILRDELEKIGADGLAAARASHLERYERMRTAMTGGLAPGAAPAEPRSRLEAEIADEGRAERPVLVELDPPRVGKPGLERVLAGAETLAARGIRYITLGDNPGREPRLGRDVFAGMVRARVPDVELVLHISCADKTLVAFATEMESLHHLSPNVLVISGDPPTGVWSTSSAPYDLRSVTGLRAFTLRAQGISLTWEEGLPPLPYYVGAAFNPIAVRKQAEIFATKTLHAGASFAMTQPIFDVATVERTADAFVELAERVRVAQGRRLAVFPGVMQITTRRNAQLLRKGFGMPVGKELIAKLGDLDDADQRKLGRDTALEVLEAVRARPEVFSGLYYVPQFHAYEETADLLAEARWLPEPARA